MAFSAIRSLQELPLLRQPFTRIFNAIPSAMLHTTAPRWRNPVRELKLRERQRVKLAARMENQGVDPEAPDAKAQLEAMLDKFMEERAVMAEVRENKKLERKNKIKSDRQRLKNAREEARITAFGDHVRKLAREKQEMVEGRGAQAQNETSGAFSWD